MSYTDDAALAKLSALNDTQDSIATAAQWFLFHRRHAERTVQLWHQRLKDSPSSKRLTMIYLANEVAQQSKVRRKDDFVVALSPVIADAMATAYRGASPEVQARLRRVVEVWRDRCVFEEPIQAAVESRIQELDRSRGGNSVSSARGGQTPQSVPSELNPIMESFGAVTRASLPARAALTSSREEYSRLTDPNMPTPTPPVHAARLNGLLKSLSGAENAINEGVKARKRLIDGLESMLESARREMVADEENLREIVSRKAEVDGKKYEVEMSIMRGLSVEKTKSPDEAPSRPEAAEPGRPEFEALTPPPGGNGPYDPPKHETMSDGQHGIQTLTHQPAVRHSPAPGIELLSSLASQYQSVPVNTNGSNKRRRIDSGDEIPDLGGDEIDADVAEILRKESHSS